MAVTHIILLTLIFAGVAILYASVGHGGASGYLAAMALFGLAPATMKPIALVLNILVAAIATYKYLSAGRFAWRIFWPFAITSIPCAYWGGLILLPGHYYKPIIGLVLIYAGFRFVKDGVQPDYQIKTPFRAVMLALGAVLGLLSGLVGVGGGIFLSPLLITLRWERVKTVSGISALFILVNSLAGLLGFLASNSPSFPPGLPMWLMAVAIGGYIGAEYGSQRLGNVTIKRLLSLVLLVAGVKMLVTV
jgi:uncharacterized membrane protein YfcA